MNAQRRLASTELSPFQKAKSLLSKSREQFNIYMTGISLFFEETKVAILLKRKIKNDGYIMTRKEFIFLQRNKSDRSKLVPFMLLALLAPEAIPFLLVAGSDIIPSTCVTPANLVVNG